MGESIDCVENDAWVFFEQAIGFPVHEGPGKMDAVIFRKDLRTRIGETIGFRLLD